MIRRPAYHRHGRHAIRSFGIGNRRNLRLLDAAWLRRGFDRSCLHQRLAGAWGKRDLMFGDRRCWLVIRNVIAGHHGRSHRPRSHFVAPGDRLPVGVHPLGINRFGFWCFAWQKIVPRLRLGFLITFARRPICCDERQLNRIVTGQWCADVEQPRAVGEQQQQHVREDRQDHTLRERLRLSPACASVSAGRPSRSPHRPRWRCPLLGLPAALHRSNCWWSSHMYGVMNYLFLCARRTEIPMSVIPASRHAPKTVAMF